MERVVEGSPSPYCIGASSWQWLPSENRGEVMRSSGKDQRNVLSEVADLQGEKDAGERLLGVDIGSGSQADTDNGERGQKCL